MASAPFDWSPVGKTLVESYEVDGNSQLPSSALIRPTQSWGQEDRLSI